jgi:Uma2 family endonuclease
MNQESPTGIAGTQIPPMTGSVWVPMEMPVLPPEDLPYDDGEPLESNWHRIAMNLLIEVVSYHFRDRDDFFAGGNMFIYFSLRQVRDRDFRGPDFFFVWGVPRRPDRHYYAVWDEGGRYPNVIIELLSPSTAEVDRTDKREIYQNIFRTPEYFLCDPQTDTIEGLRLGGGQVYEPIVPDERGWLWCEQLQLWLGNWQGEKMGLTATWPRFYDAGGRLVPTEGEAERQRAQQEQERAQQEQERAQQEHERAQQEHERAQQEHERAQQEQERARQEKERADVAVAEVARLRRELEEMRQRASQPPSGQDQP